MNKQQLLDLGFTEEQAESILKLHKSAIDGNYVPKQTFEDERNKVKTLTETVADRDKQISSLKSFEGDNTALKAKIETLENDNKKAKSEYETKLKRIELESAVKLEISDKVIDVEDVLPKLDFDKIEVQNGKITKGLDDQINALKTSKPHYFKSDEPKQTPNGWLFGSTPKEGSEDKNVNGQSQDELFGKLLAKDTISGNITEKASKAYFQ